ncbi:MAG: substrate-binding domain-containing protein, partial [Thermoplasmata archaeon]|nr:substrate-binding domain-containing protein [Thermoplasmata archaeon]
MTWIGVIVVIVIVIALVGGAYAAGWIGKSSPSTSGSGYQPPCASLNSGGSTFVYPLMAVWTSDYASQSCSANNGFSSVDIVYSPVGSGTGITDLTDKLYDFGASDAPLTSAQVSALPSPALTLPDSAGAVTIMYNIPKVATGLNLTGPILAAIFLGDITRWNASLISAFNPG